MAEGRKSEELAFAGF
jgi:hypothetical protein